MLVLRCCVCSYLTSMSAKPTQPLVLQFPLLTYQPLTAGFNSSTFHHLLLPCSVLPNLPFHPRYMSANILCASQRFSLISYASYLQVEAMGLVDLPDIDHFTETHQIEKTEVVTAKLHRINKWNRAQKATPRVPTLCCAMVDDKPVGLVLTKILPALPQSHNVEETKHGRELRSRFAKAGDLEEQSLTWKFTVIPNYWFCF